MIDRRTTAGVIATYNQSGFIGEAVASLADQVDELIVVDDASPDDTPDVLAAITRSNVRVVRNDRQLGVSRSFNIAVEMASAEIIFIQGGDDRSTPDRVEKQLRAFDDPRTVLSASVPLVLNEFGANLPDWVASEFLPDSAAMENLVHLFSIGNMICAPTTAMKRADFIDLGGVHIGLDHLQDYHLWLKLAERGNIAILPEPVVEYRKHTSNLSRAHLGIDSPRLRRLRAEKEFILTDFLANATQDTLLRLAAASRLELREFGRLEHDEQAALLQLDHADRLLVRRGLAFVLQKLGEKDGVETLERMGLSTADLSRLAVKADHDNGEDLGRALAVRRDHEVFSTPTRRNRRKGGV